MNLIIIIKTGRLNLAPGAPMSILPLLALVLPTASAGERFLAWSYGADTVPQGEMELEPISTLKTHHEGDALVAEWKHEAELEFGITNALEGGVYFVTTQVNDGPLSYSGYKARARYRFWPLGTKGVDMAGYLEYIGSPTFEEHGVEAKLIVAHEGKSVRAALNVTGELELSPEGTEPVLEPTAGAVWRATPSFAFGGEAKAEVVFVGPLEGPFFWAGPTVHLAGGGGRLSWTVSTLFALSGPSRDDAEVQARSLFGIDL